MKAKKKSAKPKPLFRIEFDMSTEAVRLWRIVSVANGKNILSSTSQDYARTIDMRREALKLARAFKAGRVEIGK